MIGVALALVVLGVIGLFVFPLEGLAVGIVGILLVIVYLAGSGKPARQGKT